MSIASNSRPPKHYKCAYYNFGCIELHPTRDQRQQHYNQQPAQHIQLVEQQYSRAQSVHFAQKQELFELTQESQLLDVNYAEATALQLNLRKELAALYKQNAARRTQPTLAVVKTLRNSLQTYLNPAESPAEAAVVAHLAQMQQLDQQKSEITALQRELEALQWNLAVLRLVIARHLHSKALSSVEIGADYEEDGEEMAGDAAESRGNHFRRHNQAQLYHNQLDEKQISSIPSSNISAEYARAQSLRVMKMFFPSRQTAPYNKHLYSAVNQFATTIANSNMIHTEPDSCREKNSASSNNCDNLEYNSSLSTSNPNINDNNNNNNNSPKQLCNDAPYAQIIQNHALLENRLSSAQNSGDLNDLHPESNISAGVLRPLNSAASPALRETINSLSSVAQHAADSVHQWLHSLLKDYQLITRGFAQRSY
jgi:hypothetical protein